MKLNANSYSCTYGQSETSIDDRACWSTLQWYINQGVKTILIDKYTADETQNYIKLIVDTINKIQPCKLVTIGKKTYIEYTLIGHYNNDILLLNFIRNLWYEQSPGHSVFFFKKLKELRVITKAKKLLGKKRINAFKALLTANKYASEQCQVKGYGHHCNTHQASFLKVMNLPKDYHTVGFDSTREFLCLPVEPKYG